MNNTLTVHIPAKPSISYPILIAAGASKNLYELLVKYCAFDKLVDKLVIITDDNVVKLYGEDLYANLIQHGCKTKLIIVAHGEASKSATTKLAIEDEMFKFACDRRSVCIALGGGVIGDLAGFVAATYMRGIRFLQVPTSMLAMIDSSVGGKVAVNNAYGKNNVGAFWQPQAVIMDLELLRSLPKEQVINGFFEAVKIFLTSDGEYFKLCYDNLDAILNLNEQKLVPVLSRAIALKAQVVEADETERNLRMILNFGHTIAHALEKLSSYTILHGFAVGVGMLVEARIATILGLLSVSEYNQIAEFLSRLAIDIPVLQRYSSVQIIQAMYGDKKNTNQIIVMVLLTGIGSVKNIGNKVAFKVDEAVIAEALEYFINTDN